MIRIARNRKHTTPLIDGFTNVSTFSKYVEQDKDVNTSKSSKTYYPFYNNVVLPSLIANDIESFIFDNYWPHRMTSIPPLNQSPTNINTSSNKGIDIPNKNRNNHDHIVNRTKVYTRLYAEFLRKTETYRKLKNRVDKGECIQIIDENAPFESTLITLDFLQEQINSAKSPNKRFGHGHILAGLLADLSPNDYT